MSPLWRHHYDVMYHDDVAMTSRTTMTSPEPTVLHRVKVKSRSGGCQTFDLWPRSNEVKPLTFYRGQMAVKWGQTFDLWPQSNGCQTGSNLWPLTTVKRRSNEVKPLTFDRGLTVVKRGQTFDLWPWSNGVKRGQTFDLWQQSNLWPLTAVKRGQAMTWDKTPAGGYIGNTLKEHQADYCRHEDWLT